MGLLGSLCKFYNFWYYQYILHTGLYMLEIWERRVFTSLLGAFFLMASYTGYLYLPGHIAMLEHFIQLYVYGYRSESLSSSTTDSAEPTVSAQRHS